MNFEKSCGAVIIKKENGFIKTLLIRMLGGHWSFPKGHVENQETEIQTALREIKEETNLDVLLDTRFREISTYSPKEETIKDVVFFIGFIKNNDNENIIIQETELKDAKWFEISQALEVVTYNDDKEILKKAMKYLLDIKY